MTEFGFNTGTIILALIGLLSVIAFTIILERLWFFRKNRADEKKILSRLKSSLEKGYYDEALAICESSPSLISNLMKIGIEHRNYSPQVIKDRITDAANLQIPELERNISALGTIAHISPLLGLLGTVTGNIQAFSVLGNFGVGADPGLLASGIAEALITTAAGIIVSIPAVVFYNYLVSRVNHMIILLETRVGDLVLALKGRHE
ncbi:MotA/TolQ/ExbB proton channel family protein [Spirochaeta lutea]|uniref:Flagellar motor protein MotA n=1 Tax=Spirochaeta lutea TaxID=1480694 RepID=A0A098R1Z0_9SPIO|nr:MotA/TolQ/ExbB proton channel family protein [Spirochaeta lutea]KGE73781.1 flagellar motor protein MotA [Spirochaeta lutea]